MVLRWGAFLDIMPTKQPLFWSLHAFYIYVNVINVIFSCFTAVLMGWGKFGTSIDFGYHVCNFYVIYQIVIYIF